jgi:hypothetical protein
MSGGIVQLVATGAQDAWLTGKPEISFFRSNYKRYTHYAHSVERQVIQGIPQAGGISTIRFERKGDLLSYVYFTARDNNNAGVANLDWSKVIDKIDLLIGGQVVDTQDFQWMSDVEPIVGAQSFSQRYLNTAPGNSTNQKTTFFPLKFFFCKDTFLALPLVSLQYADVELRINWSSQMSATVNFGPTTNPLLAATPMASINVASAVTFTGLTSNVTNVALTTTTGLYNGPIFPGMLLSNVAPGTVDFSTSSVVQSIYSNLISASNTFTSNLVVSFSNIASPSSSLLYPANTTANLYSPVASASTVGATTVAAGQTSLVINIARVASMTSETIQPGQYVAGLPMAGPVVVASSTSTTVTVTFPSALEGSIPAGTVFSFFPGVAVTTTTYSQLQFVAWANYIYLDQAERKFFADNTHDLLIHQVQRVPISNQPVQELALAHPVKYIAFQSNSYATVFQNGNNSVNAANYYLKTQINGVDVGEYKSLSQYVDVPQYYNTPFGYVHNNAVSNVAIISYCLDTSKNQPTGTINFSRLDTYRLVTPVQLTNGLLALTNPAIANPYLYAVNYNVLRIQNGLGSLLYAN